jgi:hypothetical protein
MPAPFLRRNQRQAFVLLEAMLAVAIFAIAVISLGRCISQGLGVERVEVEDTRALRVLENRAAEVEAGARPITSTQEQIAGINGGLTLKQTSAPARKKNEHGQELANLFLVNLEAAWTSNGSSHARTLNFYVFSQ